MGVGPPPPFALDPRFHINIRSTIGILASDTHTECLSTQPKHKQILSPRFSLIYDLKRSVDLGWLFDHGCNIHLKWSCYYFLNFNNRWKVHFLCSIWTSTLRPSGWCSTKRTNKSIQVFAVWGLWYMWRLYEVCQKFGNNLNLIQKLSNAFLRSLAAVEGCLSQFQLCFK